MTKSADERELLTDDVGPVDTEDALIARIAADRCAGKNTTRDVGALLKRTGKKNRAALDRLVK